MKQLNLRDTLDWETYSQIYMRDDSNFTMYIDLVEGKYSGNSTIPVEERHTLKDTIEEMFQTIKNSCKN